MNDDSDMILDDWRRWLYIDGFLHARPGDSPALVARMMDVLGCYIDDELYASTGRSGGRKLPGLGGPSYPYDVSSASGEASRLRASITVTGPYGDVPVEVQLAAGVIGNFFDWMERGEPVERRTHRGASEDGAAPVTDPDATGVLDIGAASQLA